MTNPETPSVWNQIKKKVEEDLAKAAFDNLKNYGVIGLILYGVKKAFLTHSPFLIAVGCLMLIPTWFLFKDNLLHTQIIATLALIAKRTMRLVHLVTKRQPSSSSMLRVGNSYRPS